ncbi:uncharacterized protein LOC106091766 [Stomoxys calcitrans]|nr:uncharacterized protein LOC106091766 [Stomoxys calcitrans]
MDEDKNVADSQEMQKAIQRRDLLKGSMKRILAFVQNPPANISSELIKTRLSRLEDVWKEFTENTEALYQFKNEKDYVDPEEDYYEYEDMYMNAKSLFNSLIPKQTDDQLIVDKQSTLITQLLERISKLESTGNSNVQQPREEDDFPQIVIKPFDGNYNEWPMFENLFNSALDTKPDWKDIQKFKYLKTLLRGNASNVVQNIPVNDEAFTAAWKSLKEHFDRPRLVANFHIQTFLNHPALKNFNSKEIRSICGVAGEVIRALDSIGETERDPWIIWILMTKLNSDIYTKWNEHTMKDPKPTVASFLNFLDQFCNELGSNDDHYYQKATGTKKEKHHQRSSSVQSIHRPAPVNSNGQATSDAPSTNNGAIARNRPQQRRQFYKNKSNQSNQAAAQILPMTPQFQPNSAPVFNPFKSYPI